MKILVADDSAVAREATSRLLISAGHQVVFAADGVEALRVLFAEQPDLLLLDLEMPRITGWVVCRRKGSLHTLNYQMIQEMSMQTPASSTCRGLIHGLC